jgi:hypothetical protein
MADAQWQEGRASSFVARLRSIRAAAVAGIVAAIGWLIVFVDLLDSPDVDASDAEIIDYYSTESSGPSILFDLQILVIATIAFLWFIGVIRDRIGEHEPKLFGTVFLGAGILVAVLMFVGVAALATPALLVFESDRVVDPDSAAMTRTLSRILLGVITPRVASVFIFSLSAAALRTHAFPRWLIVVSYGVGIGMFVDVTFSSPSTYVFPAWIALVSVHLLLGQRRAEGLDGSLRLHG